MKGKVLKFRDNVNTDEIMPARYCSILDYDELAKYCMKDIDTTFVQRVQHGDIIVAGENFGCGSSREVAPIAIKACGVSFVVAASFARIFYRNAINIGLPVVECKAFVRDAKEEDIAEIVFESGEIVNNTRKKKYTFKKSEGIINSIIEASGLMNFCKNITKMRTKT